MSSFETIKLELGIQLSMTKVCVIHFIMAIHCLLYMYDTIVCLFI